MTFVLPFPAIDPVLITIGPFAIRWYALAYIGGLLLGWRLMLRLARRWDSAVKPPDIDDLLVWVTIGIVLGGRLGYTLFYKPAYFLANPIEILQMWQGGMSFHGGILGFIVALVLFARRRGIPLLTLSDLCACVAPIGLFLGRVANFINGELWGRVSDVPWAMVFPRGGPAPRHPSQLYEASLEGLLLFVVLVVLSRKAELRQRPGLLTGVFFLGYGLARIFVELYRQPDAHLGFIAGSVTMGQLLSAPMIALGLYLIVRGAGRAVR